MAAMTSPSTARALSCRTVRPASTVTMVVWVNTVVIVQRSSDEFWPVPRAGGADGQPDVLSYGAHARRAAMVPAISSRCALRGRGQTDRPLGPPHLSPVDHR